MRTPLPPLLLLCSLFTARGAPAQPADPARTAAAQALYDAASAEMDANQFEPACPKLEEVTRLVPEGIGARLTLAECYEGEGKLASAWSQYMIAESMAARAGQTERAARAAAKAGMLKGRYATLTIVVLDPARVIKDLAITRAGVPVGEAQWGAPLPVDKGSQEIMVTAPGYKRWTRRVEVARDGDAITVAIEAPEVEVQERPISPAARPTGPGRPWLTPLGVAAVSAGTAGLIAGGVFGGLAISRNDASTGPGLCDQNSYCTTKGTALRREAQGFASASTAAFVVGGALAAGGVILFVAAPAPKAAAAPSARLELLPNGMGIAGSF